jgi:hypothetical protein
LGITPGQIDTFEDGTTQGWSTASVITPPFGSPGSGSHVLQVSSGGSGLPLRLEVFNRSQWLGNFLAAEVTEVAMDLRNGSFSGTLPMRIAIREGTAASITAGYASTTAFSLPNDLQWHHAVFSLAPGSLTPIDSPQPLASDLANVLDFRLLSSASPATMGDVIAQGVFYVDNIRAVPAPAPGDFNRDGALSITDLQAMLKAMTDLNMWKSSYDASDADLLAIGDLDHSGAVTNRDVQGLLNLLASQGGGTTAAVPEPSSLILMACGMTLCWCRQPKNIARCSSRPQWD